MPELLVLAAGVSPVDYRRIEQLLAHLPREIDEMLERELRVGIEDAYGWMVRERMSGGPESGRSTSLRLRRGEGRLIESFRHEVTGGSGETKVARIHQVGSRRLRMIARALHDGATIRPRRAGALAIPLIPEARRQRPRNVPGLFLLRTKRGKAVLALRTAAKRLQFWYVLVKQAILPPRPFVDDTATLWLPRILRNIQRGLTRLVAGEEE